MILGIDVGGTFTDFVLLDDRGQVHIHKLLTSASDPSLAILRGIDQLEPDPDATVVHGTTVATNALLERRGARTALITTEGFRDVLEIGRQTRPDLYAIHPVRPPPLIPRKWRFELPERTNRSGHVEVPLDLASLDRVIDRILAEGIESVAVSFLFSFLNRAHEQQVLARFDGRFDGRFEARGSDGPLVSLSSDVLPEYREYERTSTTVINAYVAPLMARYLSRLEAALGRRLRIMQSNGGVISAQAARAQAARTVLSGPAGGVVGAFEVARQAGIDHIITFDMGGTSTDVSLCAGRVEETAEGTIAGLPMRLPILDIHTVGAGGGSLAHLDAGGALRVGPSSAGSDPGPVCYGRSDAHEVTVTDANLVLGRLDPGRFLGGRMRLDLPRTRLMMEPLARQLGSSVEEAAWGIIRVANSNMERAIRTRTVERGYDPREFALVAFGGAGPLHACELAAAMGIPRVLVPPFPGVLSALGMVLADVVKDYSQTVMAPVRGLAPDAIDRWLAPLYERAHRDLAAEGFEPDECGLQPALDMRYAGQSYELAVPLPPQAGTATGWEAHLAGAFHDAHRFRFSYASPGEPVEIVNVRLKAVGRTAKPRLTAEALAGPDPSAAFLGSKAIWFAGRNALDDPRPLASGLYDRDRLAPGNVVSGPAVIFQLDTTTILPPGWRATMDASRNLVAATMDVHRNLVARTSTLDERTADGSATP